MENMPTLYWRVVIEKDAGSHVQFLTAAQIKARGLIAKILDESLTEDYAYAQIAPGNYRLLSDWMRDHRKN
jgi:hypothetical protein